MEKALADVLDREHYQTMKFKDDIWLTYSKTKGDNLPVQAAQLSEVTPCYIPYESQTSRLNKTDYHQTEKDAQ